MTITAALLRPAAGENDVEQILKTIGVFPSPGLEATADAIEAVHIAYDALYPESLAKQPFAKSKSAYRAYTSATERVKAFYNAQHTNQTYSFNLLRRAQFHSPTRLRPRMTIWEAIETLNTLVDDSDPDTQLSQIEHLMQTAEALRAEGKPRWMQLTGLIHDLGKIMFLFPEMGLCQEDRNQQWDVVGDTFPVGCAFCPNTNIYPSTFAANPDSKDPVYSTKLGVYKEGCGLDNVMLSWGHDEYMYHVLKDPLNGCLLPKEALAIVRYHSFYPWHRENGYRYLMAEGDEEMLKVVREFNPFDLYSKTEERLDVEGLKPYYLELIDEFFPKKMLFW
ncbi:myo-inositol oxygenase [Kalaharituber pfeilii]|nr:myo-inositol oxygenase [Kalaharituber pfeilii]